MDSSIEGAKLAQELEELGQDELLKAMTEARAESDKAIMEHILREQARKDRRARHTRRPR